MIIGLFSGFFYRELTKAYDFTEYNTIITCTHTYTYFRYVYVLILLPLEKLFKLSSYYLFNWFFYVYNIGVIVTIGMMVTKGFFKSLVNHTLRSICRLCRYWAHRYACRFIVAIFFLLRQAILKEPRDESFKNNITRTKNIHIFQRNIVVSYFERCVFL